MTRPGECTAERDTMSSTCQERLRSYMSTHGIRGDHLVFPVSCHSVAEAAAAAGVRPADFVKSICMVTPSGELVVAVVKGEDRADRRRLGRLLGEKPPRLATPEEILAATGYPCGGTPPFGFPARYVIDERVLEQDVVYAGGGSATALVRIAPAEMQRANGGIVAPIRKHSEGQAAP